jgi:hypothetical protein
VSQRGRHYKAGATHCFRQGDFDRQPFWTLVLYPAAAGGTTMGLPEALAPSQDG